MPTFEFDRTNLAEPVIRVLSPDTSVSVQELVDAVRDYEDELSQLHLDAIIAASGKQDIDVASGEAVGITLELINDWRLEFEARAGPSYTSCFVRGGNLIATNSFGNNPIKPSAFTQVQIRQSQSPTLITTLVDAVTQSILDLLEGDEELGNAKAYIRHKVTKAVLREKNVSGGATIPNAPITLVEP